jgi:hypothetical protein
LPFPLPLPLPSALFRESSCISFTPRLCESFKAYPREAGIVRSLNDTKVTFFDACQNRELRLIGRTLSLAERISKNDCAAVNIFPKSGRGSDRDLLLKPRPARLLKAQ